MTRSRLRWIAPRTEDAAETSSSLCFGLVLEVLFEIGVEIFIGVVFRRIGGKIEHLELILVLRQPCPHLLRVMDAQVIDNEEEATARLALAPKSRVLKLERLRHAAGEPFALETCYLSAARFGGLQSAQLHKESLFATLERDFEVELGYSDEEVDATTADPRTAELLGVPKRDALLRIRQVIYSTKGVVILYVLGLYRSDRHNLVIRRYR